MTLFGLHIQIALIYFVYGLAFFSMGLVMALESRRSPLLAEAHALRPLAFFGLVHGAHEWLEMILMQPAAFGLTASTALEWVRLILLISSFFALVLFSLRILRPGQELHNLNSYTALGLLALYVLMVAFTVPSRDEAFPIWLLHADAWARYLLAIPGAALAALALERQARGDLARARPDLAGDLRLAAWGFGFYGATQLFVAPQRLLLADFLNTATFSTVAGFPIQLLRAVLAVAITVGLFRAAQAAERERQRQLFTARRARIEALEQLQRESVEREALRKQLLGHIVTAQEEERARIARELHDETAQSLAALSLNLATLQQNLPHWPGVDRQIAQSLRLSKEISTRIYHMIRDLRPAQLDDLGLVPALQYLIDEGRERKDLEVKLSVEGPPKRLDTLVETVIFRVAQEALANVSRHSGAERAALCLRFDPGRVVLQVSDEGVGFDPDASLTPPRGWGLAGMRERAASVGGYLQVLSSPGAGTRVQVEIPSNGLPNRGNQNSAEELVDGDHSLNVG